MRRRMRKSAPIDRPNVAIPVPGSSARIDNAKLSEHREKSAARSCVPPRPSCPVHSRTEASQQPASAHMHIASCQPLMRPRNCLRAANQGTLRNSSALISAKREPDGLDPALRYLPRVVYSASGTTSTRFEADCDATAKRAPGLSSRFFCCCCHQQYSAQGSGRRMYTGK
ncbi:hypothetical protein BDV10DRAFT_98802 [Aspergillus recurvatus]